MSNPYVTNMTCICCSGSDGPTGPTGGIGNTGPTGPTGPMDPTNLEPSFFSVTVNSGYNYPDNGDNILFDVPNQTNFTLNGDGSLSFIGSKLTFFYVSFFVTANVSNSVSQWDIGIATTSNPQVCRGGTPLIQVASLNEEINFSISSIAFLNPNDSIWVYCEQVQGSGSLSKALDNSVYFTGFNLNY